MERGILSGLAAFRWAAWAWMAAVLVAGRHDLVRPWLAVGLVSCALVVTVVFTVLLRTAPMQLLRPLPVAAELACAAALVLGDGLAYGRNHVFTTAQSLGVAWPLAGVLGVGVAAGTLAGAGAGVLVGLARVASVAANGVAVSSITGGRALSLASTTVLYTLAGATSGHVARLLRRAEREISVARAREEVSRTLHDGVLQTLALVQRRATDPVLARLAREQDRELREYLFGTASADLGGGRGGGDLGAALRAVAARFEDAFGGRAEVLVADDVSALGAERVTALAGAVGEAMTNAGKHGRATKVVVYVEPSGPGDEGVFCSVKDDGCGFDTARVKEGIGLSQSIRGRMSDVGGRAEVRSRPGEGAEVCLWFP